MPNLNEEFYRIKRLPPYVFSIVNELKAKARRAGEDIIDLGMGNPDQPTPHHIIEKAKEAMDNPRNHRYSVSRGVYKLRLAISDWYRRRYDVTIDADTEAIATIGAKEGLAHLATATIAPGDIVFVPTPSYPIHAYAQIIAGGEVIGIPMEKDRDFIEELEMAMKLTFRKAKMLVISFPHNPTTAVVDLQFMQRIVDFAREHDIWVIHDLAYADLVYDGYKAPSIMQVPGAKDVAVEFFSMSKSYNMAGWRIGFCVGNPKLIGALAKLKSYFDYGMYQPLQIAGIIALNGPQDCVEDIRQMYQHRRDVLVDGLNKAGWNIEKPKGTMFVWAEIPDEYKKLGSLEFSKLLLKESKVAVSPGIGFGEYGDNYVRFALCENEHRLRQAVRGIRHTLGGTPADEPKADEGTSQVEV